MWAVIYTDELGKTVVDVFPANEHDNAVKWASRMISLGLSDAKVYLASDMGNIHS